MPEDAGLDIDFDAPPGDLDRQLAEIQAQTAGVVPDVTHKREPSEITGQVTDVRSVEFMGKKFRIADKIGLMPLLKFSAFSNVDVSDPRALSAMYAMLRDCIHPGDDPCGKCDNCRGGAEYRCQERTDRGDWSAFEDHAMITRASADDLMDVITKVMELISGRPTQQPATSSGGRRTSSGGSTGTSSGRRARGSRR